MSVSIDAIDQLINETLVASKKIPTLDGKFLANTAIGIRLAILQEARSAVMKAEMKRLENEKAKLYGPEPGEDLDDYK